MLALTNYDVDHRSKKQYTWTFLLNGKKQLVDLVCSFLTGKKKVYLNEKLIHSQQKYGVACCFDDPKVFLNRILSSAKFQMDFKIDDSVVFVYQTEESTFDLQINHDHFSSLFEVGE